MEYTMRKWKVIKYHVKGEWNEQKDRWYVVAPDGTIIAENLTEANANLIAAAPDCHKGLEDALKEICKMCVRLNPQHEGCTSCEEMERSRLPLLKAEGR